MTKENQHVTASICLIKMVHDLLVVSAIGVFIGFLAPFGMDNLPMLKSIGFWLTTSICGYLIYMPTTLLGERLLYPSIQMRWMRYGISSLVASVLMSFVVPVLTLVFFDIPLDYASQFWGILPKAIVIGTAISIATLIKDHIRQQQLLLAESEQLVQQVQDQEENKPAQQLQQFMEQLPVEKRGQLICLEMSDHYLKVHTEHGHHLLLLRFKDALAMLTLVDGMQTHRSWWIAKDAVQSVNKQGRKIVLVMNNQVQVPVSKTYIEAVKKQHFYVA